MNYRAINLGGGVRFYSKWALYEAAKAAVERDIAIGLVSHRADVSTMALEGQAHDLLETKCKGKH